MDFILATNNMKKLAEMQRILSPLGINVVTAKMLGKSAACLLTVVDSIKKKASLSAEDRQKSLNDMIKLALDTSIKLT